MFRRIRTYDYPMFSCGYRDVLSCEFFTRHLPALHSAPTSPSLFNPRLPIKAATTAVGHTVTQILQTNMDLLSAPRTMTQTLALPNLRAVTEMQVEDAPSRVCLPPAT
ncbi:hypothetical protein B0H19DRAFT_1203458 [Mycena capillaripes]|nr:hypothetical protein B0H19DRAFT_1203458 [Mycena capillaripes]